MECVGTVRDSFGRMQLLCYGREGMRGGMQRGDEGRGDGEGGESWKRGLQQDERAVPIWQSHVYPYHIDGQWSFFYFWKVIRDQQETAQTIKRCVKRKLKLSKRDASLRLSMTMSPASTGPIRKLSARLSDFVFTLRSMFRQKLRSREQPGEHAESQDLILAVYADPGVSAYLDADFFQHNSDRHSCTVVMKLPIVLDCSLLDCRACGGMCHCQTEWDLFRQKLFAVALEHKIEVFEIL